MNYPQPNVAPFFTHPLKGGTYHDCKVRLPEPLDGARFNLPKRDGSGLWEIYLYVSARQRFEFACECVGHPDRYEVPHA